MKSNTFALDAGVAGGLFAALLLVYVIDAATRPSKGPAGPEADANIVKGQLKSPMRSTGKALRLAVSIPEWDDIGKLLRSLGEGYQNYKELGPAELRSANRLSDYDVLFLTCASSSARDQELDAAIRQFVQNGGTLYASDLRFDVLRGAFPEFIDENAAKTGREKQKVLAKIHDQGLQDALGKKQEVELEFEAQDWRPAAFHRDKVKLYMSGTYINSFNSKIADAPLLVKFTFKKGTVIFTSFHNEKQDRTVGEKLLKYLVFSAVTARAEAEMTSKIEEGGLSPTQSSLVSASMDNPRSEEKTYRNTKPGKLWFGLAFHPERNARLKLTVKGPDGKVKSYDDTEPFTIEYPNAPLGEWHYTVEALHLPYPNFPFTVTVAEPK
jgi:hypothetical protein